MAANIFSGKNLSMIVNKEHLRDFVIEIVVIFVIAFSTIIFLDFQIRYGGWSRY